MDTFPSKYYYAIIFAWSLCAVMFTTGTRSLKLQCNEEDKQILLNFKQGAIDPSGLPSSWSAQQDCCQWTGVKCDNFTGRVKQLNLPCPVSYLNGYNDKADKSHCLTGYFHLSLLEMESLEYLDLSNNDFLAMPSDSVNSSSCHNNLSLGTPPYHQCGNFSALRYLNLSHNENLLIHDLQWLSRISSLKYIDLGYIDLHMETNWLQLVTMLPSLSELYLQGCQLENMGPSLKHANFTALEILDLSYNGFYSELPRWLFNLTCDIFEIHLGYNHFRGQLHRTMPSLQVLNSLALNDNQLNGSIPDWLGQLEHLTHLGLSDNFFSGPLPTNLGNLSSLVVLECTSNLLTGVVSEKNFAKLSNLQSLMMESPAITFDFAFHWVPPFQLDGIYLGPVGPKLPQWLHTQTFLRSLTIVNSKFSFEAGDKFWSFASRIGLLHLQDNSIDGDLSNVLLNSTFIKLSSNNLKGGLPRLSSNVVVFKVHNNSLSGSIFPFLCDNLNGRSKLKYLDMSDNHLSGGLTNCWMNWKSLVHINLGNNNLTGKIPPSIGLLANLTSLHLHENNLFGDISSLLKCQSLSILNVRENNFSGNIPSWIPHNAKVLQLRSNQFNGNIPRQICQMPSLTILDFADNRISGHIPNCLNNITAMAFGSPLTVTDGLGFIFYDDDRSYIIQDNLMLLIKGRGSKYQELLSLVRIADLSSNDLTGTIPLQMFSLTELLSLNLSNNELTGRIPKEIGNMKQLESLDLSRNQLSGEIPDGMSNLSFLSYLNLSFNDFTGKIPSGTQLQSFSALSYIGNADLCGPPLPKNCSHDGIFHGTKALDEDDDESQFWSCLYMGLGAGFATGFWGVCAAIFFNRKWRIAYFKFLYDLRDRIYVMAVTKMNSFHCDPTNCHYGSFSGSFKRTHRVFSYTY